jgi:hypothetical protein
MLAEHVVPIVQEAALYSELVWMRWRRLFTLAVQLVV